MPTPTTVQARFQVRADTAANWTAANPTLLLNELGFETDTKKLKMGDGTTAWSSLTYFPSIVSGGTVLGNLEIGTTGTLTFEGSTADGFETTLGVIDPTADRTINLPNVSGTIVTTGDTGTVTSTMIANGTIVDADVSASAAINSTKISFGSNTISTTGIISAAAGTAAAPSITFTSDLDTGIYRPAANNFAITTNGVERVNYTDTAAIFNDGNNNYDFRIEGVTNGALFFVDASADAIGIGKSTPSVLLDIESAANSEILRLKSSNANGVQQTFLQGTFGYIGGIGSPKYWDATLSATDMGVTSNGNLDFLTNQLFRARITQAGNFGINDSAPDARLTVNGVASFGAGSAAAPGIAARGDLDTGIYFPAANTTAISTGGSERLRIDSSGRLGLGTSSPGHALHVSNGNDSASGEFVGITIGGTNSANARTGSIIKDTTTFDLIYKNQNFSSAVGAHVFRNGPSEHARIDSSGRLLVGTSSSIETNSKLQLKDGYLNIYQGASGAGAGYGVLFSTDGGATARTKASIILSETAGAGGTLTFSTTADGASSPTERMRIRADGRTALGDGLSSAGNTNSHLFIYSAGNSSNTSNVGLETYTTSASTRYAASFSNPNGVVGSISTNGSATAFTTSSDYRLKENIVPLTGAADRILQLKPSRFNFIADPDTEVDGFIAHEAQEVVPECVTGTKDEVDADGNPVYQGIDQSKLVPLLTAALQEAIAKIETLEAKVAALEAA